MLKTIIVSACLLGENCKYSGGNNYCESVAKLKEKFKIVAVCPESFGGLSTPRTPSERYGKKVIAKNGSDVTKEFLRGAHCTLKLAKKNGCFAAVLKERSPSCGVNEIYSGNFDGKTVKGSGVTAELLKQNGIKVFSEEEIDKLV